MNANLLQFTKAALERNISRDDITGALTKAGWALPDIRAALGSFSEVAFPLPIPRPKPDLSAKEVFMYVVMFAALYSTCYNIGSLLFDLINKTFPDPAQNNYWIYYGESIRWSASCLVISFPLFFITFRSIHAALLANPVLRHSKPRSILTSVTLIIATLSLTCDLATLVYNLLGGELTIRFVLKSLTVAVIAGANFIYFLHDMRKEENQ